MAKQLNVNMSFSADTSQAKAQLQDLQRQLNNLMSIKKAPGIGLDVEIDKAAKSVAELSTHLKQATNIDTGNLDFSKLNQSLKQSGKSLQEYASTLKSLGPSGEQAFMSLARSVSQAEIPTRRTNALLKEMATTIANTARWQISSSILHGLMGGLQSAYGYAKDLNESLNNIRIVTNKSVDDMKDFAEQANKAAKSLSSTTTAYTDASLIYYQQGLGEAEVAKRAETTLKMANVSRQSAQVVSDQMTAIWSNFADGSHELEYYADVLTALGAATASSSDEISQGLEKFSAVADTVGLSYEYAASALATVTAETRQSADVVGTAFKTLFARIEGLKLGETLEDGTDLNKYSEALLSVGINIKDQNGELRKMDAILNDMGAKWQTLGKDQQVALAQTVGGVRQYNTLISLMDNWDKFQQNLNTSYTSEGTLNAQAEIYADSWEAASKRVKASAEGIYQSLINDEFFIDLLNSLEKILEFTDKLIENLGGVSGVLTAIGAIVTKVFSNELSKGLTNLAYNFRMMTKSGREKEEQTRQKFINDAANQIPKTTDYSLPTEKASQTHLKHQLTLQSDYLKNADKMSQFEQETNKALIERTRILNEQSVAAAKNLEQSQEQLGLAEEALRINVITKNKDGVMNNHQSEVNQFKKNVKYNVQLQDEVRTLGREAAEGLKIERSTENQQKIVEDFKQKIKEIKARLQKEMEKEEIPIDLNLDILDNFNDVDIDPKVLEEKMSNVIVDLESGLKDVSKDFKDTTMEGKTKQEKQSVDDYIVDKKREVAMHRENKRAIEEEKTAYESAQKSINNAQGAQKQWTDILVEGANVAFSVATAVQMLGSAWDTIKDPDVSGWEKFTTVLTTVSMLIPTIVSLTSTFKSLLSETTVVKLADVAATLLQAKAEHEANNARNEGIDVSQQQKQSIKQRIKNKKQSFNQTIWDKLDDSQKDDYIRQVALKNGYFDDTKTGNIGGFAKHVANPNSKTGKTMITKISKAEASKMFGAEAMSLAGGQGIAAIGSSLAPAIAIIAAIAAAVATVTVAIKIFNKEADEAEKAMEMANKAAESFQSAKAAYDEFGNTLSSYQDATKALEGLTKGTEEYRKKVVEANEAALQLINTQNLAAGTDYEVTEDGQIKINETVLEDKQNEELKKLERAQGYSAVMNSYSKTQQTEADRTEFNRKYAKDSGEWTSEDTSLALIATVASILNPAVQPLILLGGAIGTKVNKDETSEEKKALEELRVAYEKQGESALTKENIKSLLTGRGYDEKLIKSLSEQEIATQEQIKALQENTKAINAQILQTAKTANAENERYTKLNLEEQELANVIIANRADDILNDTEGEKYTDLESEVKKGFKNVNWGALLKFNFSEAWNGEDEVYDEYLKARFGEEGAKNLEIINRGGKKANLRDKLTGEIIEEDITNDSVIAFLTNYQAQQMNQEDEEILNKFIKMGESLQANIDGLNYTDSMLIQKNLAQTGDVDLNLLSPEQINQLNKELQSGALDKILGDYVDEFKAAVDNYDIEKHKQIKEEEYSANISSAAAELEVEEEALRGYTDALIDNNAAFKDNKEAAIEAAKSLINFTKGTEELQSALDDNLEILQEWNEDAFETYEAAGQVQSALEKMFGVKVSSTFVKNHLEDIQKAAEGDVEAIDNLGKAAAKDFVVNLNIDESGKLALDHLIDELSNKDIAMGATVDVTTGIEALNELLQAGELTKDEVNSALGAIGYSANIEMEPVEGPSTKSITTGTYKMGAGPDVSYSAETETTSTILMPKIESVAGEGGSGSFTRVSTPKMKSSGAGSVTKPKTDTDSGNEPSDPVDVTQKSDVVERYKEINDQLDDIQRSMEKINKESDRLYGASRLASMKKYGKELEKEAEALKKKDKEIGKNLNEDQVHLNSVANAAGLSFQYDENGNITNYSGEMQKLYDGLHQAELSANADGGVTDAEQSEIDWWQRRIDKVKEAQEQYDETREEWEDNRDAIDENEYAQQDNNYEIISYELELNIELNEEAEKTLDYYIDKMDGDFYSMAESAALMGEKMNLTTDNLGQYATNLVSLNAAYEAGKISQADYVNGLKDNKEGVIENLQQLLEYDKYMREVYGETLRMANEKIDENSERLQHNTSILEHYLTLLELTGQSANYEAIGTVLKGQTKTLKSNYEVSKKQYEMNQAEADQQKARLDAIKDKDSKEYKMQEKKWKDAEELARQSQDQMLSDAEAYLEAEKALYENEINAISKTMEKAFTNGFGFDQINTSIERAKSLQEEYLTTTNKIYETNKLINQAQKEIDKTTNLSAKRKLQAFQQETKQLQSQGKLSQFELDLQQKEYDLLLAKIALEEAQNAKSTVRLTRDSEGNFGYVYTADQEKTADAEQRVANAENVLYNTQLDGANKYAENAAQLKEQYLEEWKEIWLNEELGKEEKDQRLMELDNYYHQKLQDNLNLYSIATDNNLNVIEDAWSTSLDLMSFTVDDWQKEVDTNTSDAKSSFDNLSSAMDKIAKEMGVDLNSLEKNVEDITKASKDLEKETTDELIPSLQDEIDEVDNLTDSYIDNYQAVEDLIGWYEDMIGEIDSAIESIGTMQSEIDTASDKLWDLINDYNSNSYVFNDPSNSNNSEEEETETGGEDDKVTFKQKSKKYGRIDGKTGTYDLIQLSNGYWFDSRDLMSASNGTYIIKSGAVGRKGIYQSGFDSSSGVTIYDFKSSTRFDTGGYTGEWGTSEGKLAYLHEKEIILNKEDTKNFLASLELLHNIIKMIDINTSNSLISRLDSADLKTNKSNDILEQHVTIEAVFPNVEDRYEIEEAFMNLTNEASQYINRKNN